jgi:hypothetical protein
MPDSFEKALSFIVFIGIGILLKLKFKSKDEENGLKKIILLLALPATIFIALLKVKLDSNLLLLPFIALGFNVFLYLITPTLLVILDITDKAENNTARLLIPSLAPGLSCFPFILEFLGEDYLAKAAMADLGNKFFVLFVLYLIAVKWYYTNQSIAKAPAFKNIKSLIKVMLFEPVNLFIIVALILVCSGVSLADLPTFIQEALNRLSYIMTPLILLFIGIAVRLRKNQLFKIFSLLMLRAGLTLFVISIFMMLSKISIKNEILFMISFSLSACSFWPFAHISSIAAKEKDVITINKTFNTDFALSILALSLPLSVIIILGVLTLGDGLIHFENVLLLSFTLIIIGAGKPLYMWLKNGAQIKKRYSQN